MSETSHYLLILILFFLFLISIKLLLSKSLLENVILTSCFSVIITISYLLMEAEDVAMTEVALGACLSTCVLLSFLNRIPNHQKSEIKQTRILTSLILSLALISVFIFTGLDLAQFGDSNSLIHTHLSKYYLENTITEIGIPSHVTAILGSYRGYDTFGETLVILIAGISLILIFSQKYDEKPNKSNV